MSQQRQPLSAQEMSGAAYFAQNAQAERPRRGRFFSCLALLSSLVLGLIVGIMGTLLYISSVHDLPAPASQSASGEAAIVIQLSSTFISQLTTKEVAQANIPGGMQNVTVKMSHNTPITIGGDNQISLFGFSVTKHLTIQLQPVIQTCQLQLSITHADLSGIPVTSFVSSFQQQLNQQLLENSKSSALPTGFVYCVTNVHTETNGLYVAYSAKPS